MGTLVRMGLPSRAASTRALAVEFDSELRDAERAHSLQQAKRCLVATAAFVGGSFLLAIVVSWQNDPDGTLTLLGTIVRFSIATALLATLLGLAYRRLQRLATPAEGEASNARIEPRLAAALALIPFVCIPYTPELRLSAAALGELVGMPLTGIGLAPFFLTLVTHIIACSLLPFRWREALIPIVPFTTLSIIGILLVDPPAYKVGSATLVAAVAAGITLPGMAICLLRTIRFRRHSLENALRHRYIEIREDLDVARRIHDRLLPAALHTGSIEVDFAYEPMRDIGGDLLFLHRSSSGAVHLALVDVTGHGIAAALLVNRIHGELQRIMGSADDPPPETTLDLLNDYLVLTSAGDSIYATALVVRVAPDSESMRYASAAHPDLLVRSADGSIRRHSSTACMLGALPRDCFDASAEDARFAVGESLLLYTDGLTESRSAAGAMLEIDGVAAVLARTDDPAEHLATLRRHRASQAQDDCMIVRVKRTNLG
jgi:hypothetical protein